MVKEVVKALWDLGVSVMGRVLASIAVVLLAACSVVAVMVLVAQYNHPVLPVPHPTNWIVENFGEDTPPAVISDLMATPQNFEGRHVLVTGFVKLGFEQNGLYFAPNHLAMHQTNFAIQLDGIEWPIPEKYAALNGGLVTVDGTFRSRERCGTAIYAGCLEVIDITGMPPHRPPPSRTYY